MRWSALLIARRALCSPSGRALEDAAYRFAGSASTSLPWKRRSTPPRCSGPRGCAAAPRVCRGSLAGSRRAARAPAPRRRVLDVGFAELTSREQEVTSLAARLTNREIADALFLSPRTVENHLQRAYEKLGVTGRDQLDAALRR